MYSPTVNLPITDFNIRGMAKVKEPEIQQWWQENEVYERLVSSNPGEPYTLHDGPPYANGDLHIGHALNKILKDIIVRRKLMEGYKAKYVPGWDTHGLPIELKVRMSAVHGQRQPSQLQLQATPLQSAAPVAGVPINVSMDAAARSAGQTWAVKAARRQRGVAAVQVLQTLSDEERRDMTPVALREKAREFALRTVDSQREHFKRYGVWGDWAQPYVTLQHEYEAAQVGVFGEVRPPRPAPSPSHAACHSSQAGRSSAQRSSEAPMIIPARARCPWRLL